MRGPLADGARLRRTRNTCKRDTARSAPTGRTLSTDLTIETRESLNRRAPSDGGILVETAHACIRKGTSMRRAVSGSITKASRFAAPAATALLLPQRRSRRRPSTATSTTTGCRGRQPVAQLRRRHRRERLLEHSGVGCPSPDWECMFPIRSPMSTVTPCCLAAARQFAPCGGPGMGLCSLASLVVLLGSLILTAPVAQAASFGTGADRATIPDQVFGLPGSSCPGAYAAAVDLNLPAAKLLGGSVTYRLQGVPSELTFDQDARRLSVRRGDSRRVPLRTHFPRPLPQSAQRSGSLPPLCPAGSLSPQQLSERGDSR